MKSFHSARLWLKDRSLHLSSSWCVWQLRGERRPPRWKRRGTRRLVPAGGTQPGDGGRRRNGRPRNPPPCGERSNRLRRATLRPLKPNVFQKWILKWVMGFGKVGFRKGLKWHSSVQLTHLREKWWTLNFKHLYPDYHGSSMAAETILLAGVGWLTQVGI